MRTSKEMLKIAYEALDEKKAEDIKIIDIHGITVIADYFIIAGGRNRNQVQAMANNVEEKLGKAGCIPKQIEGYQSANWVLMDYGDIILHIFLEEDRLFFDLEKIWADGVLLDPKEIDIRTDADGRN